MFGIFVIFLSFSEHDTTEKLCQGVQASVQGLCRV